MVSVRVSVRNRARIRVRNRVMIYRRKHSWWSIFTHMRNHSLCLTRSSHISNARFTHSLLLAVSLASGRRSALRDRAMAGLLLFVNSFINRCYLLVSGSVRVRVTVSVRARVTVRDRDRI